MTYDFADVLLLVDEPVDEDELTYVSDSVVSDVDVPLDDDVVLPLVVGAAPDVPVEDESVETSSITTSLSDVDDSSTRID